MYNFLWETVLAENLLPGFRDRLYGFAACKNFEPLTGIQSIGRFAASDSYDAPKVDDGCVGPFAHNHNTPESLARGP